MTAWLKLFARLSGTSAAGFTVLARRLRSMPATARALTDGRLSTDQARAIVACVDPDLVEQYTNTEDDLIGIVETLSVHDISHVMQYWRERARHTIPDPQPRHEQRRLHLSGLPDGTFRVDGTLTTQGGAVVDAALKSATSADTEGEPVRTATQHRADALVDLCRWYLDHCHTPPTTRRRPHLDLACGVTDLSDDDGTGRTANGFVLDTTTLHRLACDAAISRILVQGRSHVLDHGHSVRIVPAALLLALAVRDRHCRWPGCDRTPDWCDAHHLTHWAHHGPTNLTNLALFCNRHHHHIHQPNWTAQLDPHTATLTITTPDGRTMTTQPPPILDQHVHPDTG